MSPLTFSIDSANIIWSLHFAISFLTDEGGAILDENMERTATKLHDTEAPTNVEPLLSAAKTLQLLPQFNMYVHVCVCACVLV